MGHNMSSLTISLCQTFIAQPAQVASLHSALGVPGAKHLAKDGGTSAIDGAFLHSCRQDSSYLRPPLRRESPSVTNQSPCNCASIITSDVVRCKNCLRSLGSFFCKEFRGLRTARILLLEGMIVSDLLQGHALLKLKNSRSSKSSSDSDSSGGLVASEFRAGLHKTQVGQCKLLALLQWSSTSETKNC